MIKTEKYPTGMYFIYLILKYTENINSNQRIKVYIIFREKEDIAILLQQLCNKLHKWCTYWNEKPQLKIFYLENCFNSNSEMGTFFFKKKAYQLLPK